VYNHPPDYEEMTVIYNAYGTEQFCCCPCQTALWQDEVMTLPETPRTLLTQHRRDRYWAPNSFILISALDNDQLVIGNGVANDALQAEVAWQKQRRRSLVFGPASPELIERRHVATDVLGVQLQVIALQPQLSLFHSRWQLCVTVR